MANEKILPLVRGNPISPGLAEGIIHLHRNLSGRINVPLRKDSNVEQELAQLDKATAKISEDLIVLAGRVEKEIDARLAKVFEVHRHIVNDTSLKEELRKEITENLASAGSAVKSVFLRWENRFLLMESHMARNRCDDIRDISVRLSDALAGITVHPLDEIPFFCILATTHLLPSDIVFLYNRNVAAVLLEFGNTGSHAALFAREMGLPCISGIRNIQTTLPDRVSALVDADAGMVSIRPSKKQVFTFHHKIYEKEQADNIARILAMLSACSFSS